MVMMLTDLQETKDAGFGLPLSVLIVNWSRKWQTNGGNAFV